jgi:hypothetical protein
MSDEEKETWRGVLAEYYKVKGLSDREIIFTIDTVFQESQIGWPRAPRDIDTRIKSKSGYQWKSHANLQPNFAKGKEITVDTASQNISDGSILDVLSDNEREWFTNRKKEYENDFDFNQSSDKVLLDQLLVEEVIQRRILKEQLQFSKKDLSRPLNDVLKRVTELQERLGITRQQRAGILDNVDGNVAQLAISLDKKLEAMPEMLKKQYEEEVYYTHLRNQRPPVNILPSREKIEALLQVDGKISTNLGAERISAITEEVAKEYAGKKIEQRIELAEGLDVS